MLSQSQTMHISLLPPFLSGLSCIPFERPSLWCAPIRHLRATQNRRKKSSQYQPTNKSTNSMIALYKYICYTCCHNYCDIIQSFTNSQIHSPPHVLLCPPPIPWLYPLLCFFKCFFLFLSVSFSFFFFFSFCRVVVSWGTSRWLPSGLSQVKKTYTRGHITPPLMMYTLVSMYSYISYCKRIRLYICVWVHIIFIFICHVLICVDVCMHICKYVIVEEPITIYVCMWACMYMCVCMLVFMCIHVCMHVSMVYVWCVHFIYLLLYIFSTRCVDGSTHNSSRCHQNSPHGAGMARRHPYFIISYHLLSKFSHHVYT